MENDEKTLDEEAETTNVNELIELTQNLRESDVEYLQQELMASHSDCHVIFDELSQEKDHRLQIIGTLAKLGLQHSFELTVIKATLEEIEDRMSAIKANIAIEVNKNKEEYSNEKLRDHAITDKLFRNTEYRALRHKASWLKSIKENYVDTIKLIRRSIGGTNPS
jgi:hypothetical protein